MEKETLKKVTVKLEDSVYQRIVKKADRMGVSISECIRQELRNENLQTELMRSLCRVSSEIGQLHDKYDIEENDRDVIDAEVKKVWEQSK